MPHKHRPILSIVVAISQNGVIGHKGQLPWHLPADLRHFKSITMGKPIVMGRKTHASIGKNLPGRENIILSRNPHYRAPDCVILHSLEAVLSKMADTAEIMIIGGTQLYALTLPLAHRLYLTQVHAKLEGDTFFPTLDRQAWRVQSREDHKADKLNQYDYSFIQLEQIDIGTSTYPARSDEAR